MIDWIFARLPIRAARSLKAGSFVSITAEGELEYEVSKRVSTRGSHESTIIVRRVGGELEFAGSPAKYLQGHNLFGSDDLRGLGAEMIIRACKALDVKLQIDELRRIEAGEYKLLRVDINYSYAMSSREEVRRWAQAAAATGTLRYRGAGKLQGSSVVWGDKSRHWSLKAYGKGDEIAADGHELPESLPCGAELAAWANDKLRIEQQFMSRHLQKLGLERASSWDLDTATRVFTEHLAKLDLGDSLVPPPSNAQSVPSHLRLTVCLWEKGLDVRQFLTSAKYYRHRKDLRGLGINISVPAASSRAQGEPLGSYLKAPCVAVPDWAKGTSLYYGSADGKGGVRLGLTGVEGGTGCITVRRRGGVTRTTAKLPRHALPPPTGDDGPGVGAAEHPTTRRVRIMARA